MFGGGDRAVLEELYEATGGLDGSWLRDGNWCSSAPLSSWDRVEVDDDDAGTVVELLLYDNGLRGSLPRSLARLKGLRRLHVNGNALRGGVPLPLLRRLAARPPLDLRLWPGNEGMLQRCAPAAAFASPLLPQRPFFLLRVAAPARGEAGAAAVAGAAGCAKPGDGFDAARRAGALVRVVHRMGNGDLVVHAVPPPPPEEEGGDDDEAALVAGSAAAGEGGARAWGRPSVIPQARVAFLHAAVGEHGGGRVFSDAAALSAAEEAAARQQLDPALRVLPRGTEYVWAAQCCLPRVAAAARAAEPVGAQQQQQRQQAEATRLSLAYFVQSCGSFLLALPPPSEGEGALAGEERAAFFLGACGWLRVVALAALSPVQAHGCDYGGDSDDGDGQGGGWREMSAVGYCCAGEGEEGRGGGTAGVRPLPLLQVLRAEEQALCRDGQPRHDELRARRLLLPLLGELARRGVFEEEAPALRELLEQVREALGPEPADGEGEGEGEGGAYGWGLVLLAVVGAVLAFVLRGQ
jgi:hypothetical protein